ncbi:MAG TPA: class I adenylate-forming enzyme family protein [Vicinamibacterales bacterium]|nr:class I adenylate-forming enzyme family protein [Vicinamibacterales bacterium]
MSEIVERFARIRRDQPSRMLIHVPSAGVSISAQALWDEAMAYARALETLGVGADDLVVSAAGNRPGFVALILACRTLGAAIMPVDIGAPASELRALAVRFGARFAVLQTAAIANDVGGSIQPFPGGLACAALRDITPAPEVYRGAAVLKVTSGSTGLPKATFTRESQILIDTIHIMTAMDIGANDTQIAVIPLSHAYGLGNLVIPLLVQGTPIVLRDAFVPQQLHADASHYRARAFPGVPFMFAHFAGNAGALPWPRGLERLVSAGAPLDAATVRTFARAFGIKVHSFYGTSETGGISYDDSPDVEAAGTVGRALPDVIITLRADDGAPPGGGRVHVASAAVASGYAGSIGDGEGFTDDGFLTGDYGRYDARGNLVLTGRASSFINIAGKKVQPEEVERVLRGMPGIADVRVLGAADRARGQQIVACIVADGAPVTALAVRRFCAGQIAAYKVPRTIVFLDRIPLTDRGKTDRAALEARVRDQLDRTAESGVL